MLYYFGYYSFLTNMVIMFKERRYSVLAYRLVSTMTKMLSTLKLSTLILLAGFLLSLLQGCVASRKDVLVVENRTMEIRSDLNRLQGEIEQGLKAVERLDGKYDFNNSLFIDTRSLNWVMDAIVTIQTRTLFEGFRSSEPFIKVSRGTGVVSGRYVLTLNHVVTQDSLEVRTPFGAVRVPLEKLKETTYLVSENREIALKEVLRDPNLDIALFEIPQDDLALPSLPCPVGNSNDLSVGNFLYVVGNPFNSGINVREGIVSSLLGLEGVEEIAVVRDNLFIISNGVVPGDSGGPVLGLRDGVPELVGLVQGTLGSTRIGWAVKINPILESLSKHLGKREFCVAHSNEPTFSSDVPATN
jgi:S1-C subfamily serine protease